MLIFIKSDAEIMIMLSKGCRKMKREMGNYSITLVAIVAIPEI